MGPKKDKAKAADPKGGGEGGDPGENPATLLTNYTKFCKQINITANAKLVKTFTDEEALEEFMRVRARARAPPSLFRLFGPPPPRAVLSPEAELSRLLLPSAQSHQIVIDDEFGPLGAGGMRALCTAIMGTGAGMIPFPFKLVNSLRFWRCNIGDDGCASLAELLRLGGADVAIAYLELFDNNVGARGALALGRSLSCDMNKSLMTLKLDYNSSLGAEGVTALCRGLRTNSTLKQLHLPYCGVGPLGGAPLGEMLSYSKLALAVLNLQGNKLGGQGLKMLCPGLKNSASITSLSMADNGIGDSDEDLEALKALAAALVASQTLTHVDILYNRIGEKGANALLATFGPEGPPSKVRQLLVDSMLPQQLFELLCRIEAGGGGKKGKKGKGKKKK